VTLTEHRRSMADTDTGLPMRAHQFVLDAEARWPASSATDAATGASPQLVLTFGSRHALERRAPWDEIRTRWPSAVVLTCSTGGEIADTRVHDDSIVITVVHFAQAWVRGACTEIGGESDSSGAGRRLAAALPAEGLRHAFVLAPGVDVNGSGLVRGLSAALPPGVAVTGGLAADGDRFAQTIVGLDDRAGPRIAAAVGFYGERLLVGMGSVGGWTMFGPDRVITRSAGNVLFELDGHPALELYRRYLGAHAAELPASGLLFPLAIHDGPGSTPVVRTILSVDEQAGSLTFAGDLPEGMFARLMNANVDRLVDGAADAAFASSATIGSGVSPALAILISCVGRRWVLKQRAEEELESVRETVGPSTVLTGFYSYGEISPFTPDARCELHNQTMTVTTFAEV
jgi:hypothetical protein